ncbi:hypothetical protein BU23DRAFT_555158 [Bimuria novae-zelandiae CBS 107.79]|uniref:Galactose oxidase n=1 Tax=Bimuria novae-zelandiae CBS 107.79 TaxID=1447943 RepID=A0A6A5VGE7_9PLEO|nr:hypothetical protein BU23DRAFT_555158 [Bimuria novae-zelandiae CBS 107.79]
MAEVAAGAGIALAAEEVLSTTLQAGVATYFLAKPTQPLGAAFTRIAVVHDDELHKRSLTRSNHTVTVVGSKAYIFGGETSDGEVAGNEVHIINLAPEEKTKEPEYQLIPALAGAGGRVPQGRTRHAACAFDGGVVVYGGHSTNDGRPADEGIIWHFNPEENTWSVLYSPSDHNGKALKPVSQVRVFPTSTSLILLTGTEVDGINYIHKFTPASSPGLSSNRYEILTTPPTPTSASNAAFYEDHLYLISSPDAVSSQLHILPLTIKEGEKPKWTTLTFPTNPIVPGPRARHAGALLPFSTGYGRNYLVYLLGARSQLPSTTTTTTSNITELDLSSTTSDKERINVEEPTQWSDTWTLQLPSSDLQPHVSTSLKDAIKPAKIKDAIRGGVGADSGKWTWAEVEVRVPDDLGGAEAGKLHPGPRASFGADVMADGKSVVLWGGVDAEGDKVGDGWVVRLE